MYYLLGVELILKFNDTSIPLASNASQNRHSRPTSRQGASSACFTNTCGA